MTPADLAATVLTAARAVFVTRGLDVSLLPEMTVMERPRNPEHGDYASTMAMQLAKKAGIPPRELAAALAIGRPVPIGHGGRLRHPDAV